VTIPVEEMEFVPLLPQTGESSIPLGLGLGFLGIGAASVIVGLLLRQSAMARNR
jgi:LPXTG-motif cell wall-anchored protein